MHKNRNFEPGLFDAYPPRFLSMHVVIAALGFWLASPSASAQMYESSFVVWQGFQHRWTYNHPPARIGDYIEWFKCKGDGCAARLKHSSASAKRPDATGFRSFYSVVSANGVTALPGLLAFELRGKNGQIVNAEHTVKVPLPPEARGADKYVVLLSGFDLTCREKPDQIERFSISVGDGFYSRSDSSMNFDVSVFARFDCKSGECGTRNRSYDYQLTISYLALAADDAAMHSRGLSINRAYFWDRKFETQNTPPRQTFVGDTTKYYTAALVAFKRITFILSRPQNVLEWNMALMGGKYEKGKYTVTPDLFFKQWSKTMKKRSASLKHSRWTKKKAGLAEISADLTLLEFTEGCVENGTVNGRMRWTAKNRDPDADEALYRKGLTLKLKCQKSKP